MGGCIIIVSRRMIRVDQVLGKVDQVLEKVRHLDRLFSQNGISRSRYPSKNRTWSKIRGTWSKNSGT